MKQVGDMKAGLTSGARPKLSIVTRAGLVYEARAQEYGADKYARGNHHGPAPKALGEGQVAGALRLLGYIDATMRHLTRVADEINRALGTGGDLVAACSTRDMDAAGGFPASGLPDLAHAKTSLGIGISCAVDDGLLPADPGQPWTATAVPGVEALAQKDDPAAERARVAALSARPRFEAVDRDDIAGRPARFYADPDVGSIVDYYNTDGAAVFYPDNVGSYPASQGWIYAVVDNGIAHNNAKSIRIDVDGAETPGVNVNRGDVPCSIDAACGDGCDDGGDL